MMRAFFLAVAISVIILGLECMVIKKAVLAKQVAVSNPAADYLSDPYGLPPIQPAVTNKSVTPPEWAPWSLVSAGIVMMLYSVTLRRGGGDG